VSGGQGGRSLEEVARKLAVSSRTLIRRLVASCATPIAASARSSSYRTPRSPRPRSPIASAM